MNLEKMSTLFYFNVNSSIFKIFLVLTFILSFHSNNYLAYAVDNSSNDVVLKAQQLQLDGTRMQLQGNIDGAIRKYQESLALQPNNNLESLLQKLEKQNSKVGDGSSKTQGAVITVEPVGRVEELAKPTAQPASPVAPVVDRQGPPDQPAAPVLSEAKDNVSVPIAAGESQPTAPLPTVEPPGSVQEPTATVLPPQDRPAADQQVAERPDRPKEAAALQSPVTDEPGALPVAEKQHPDAKTEAVAEPSKQVNQQALPPQSPQNQVSPPPAPLSQAPDAEPKANLPADSSSSQAPMANGTPSGSTAPIAVPDLPAQQPVQTEMPQPAPQPLPVPTKRTNDGVDVPANSAEPDRVEQPMPASSGGAGQAVPAEEVQVEQRSENAQKTEDLSVGREEK